MGGSTFCFVAGLGVALGLCSACGRAPREQTRSADRTEASGHAATVEEAPREAEEREEGGRPQRDPVVYVDGVPAAALAYLELPASLPTVWKIRTNGRRVRRFRVADLLQSLGVELASVKQVHLYGGRDRISIIDGSELRRLRSSLFFSFTQGDRGRPRVHYPDEAMKVRGRIDLLDDMTVYVRREPPVHSGKYQTLTHGDGRTIEGIPYSNGERPGGTRVYVDGALRTFVKRRSLPAPGGSADDPESRSLREYLETLGIPWHSVTAMELLGSSDVLTCLDSRALSATPLTFTLPRHRRGFVAVGLPEVSEPVRAIALYTKTRSPDRSARALPTSLATPPGMRGVGSAPARRCARVGPD